MPKRSLRMMQRRVAPRRRRVVRRRRLGALASMELILVGTIVVLGTIVGLATYRDALVQELGDTAAAVGELSQGYDYALIDTSGSIDTVDYHLIIAGSTYQDLRNDGQPADPDLAGDPPAGITIDAALILDEGDVLPIP